MKALLQSTARRVTQLAITTSTNPADDQWRDVYRVENLPALPAGTILRVHLNKHLEAHKDFPYGVAWLRRFELRHPGGVYLVTENLGLNITPEDHYESYAEGGIFVVPVDLPAGCSVAYMGRARSYVSSPVPSSQRLVYVWDKGKLSVEIETPVDEETEELRNRIMVLEAAVASLLSVVQP